MLSLQGNTNNNPGGAGGVMAPNPSMSPVFRAGLNPVGAFPGQHIMQPGLQSIMSSQQPSLGMQGGGQNILQQLMNALSGFLGGGQGQANGSFGPYGGFRPDWMQNFQAASGNPSSNPGGGFFQALMNLFSGGGQGGSFGQGADFGGFGASMRQ